MRIYAPDLNYINALDFCRLLHNLEFYDTELVVDFNRMSNYDPFSMLIVSSALRKFGEIHPGIKLIINVDKYNTNAQYAGHMGFFKSISENLTVGKKPGEARGSANYIPITPITIEGLREESRNENIYITQKIENESKKLGQVLSQGNKDLDYALTFIIREIMRNIEEHSEADTIWICAQHWPRYQLVEIGILDEGQGVRNSLQRNIHYRDIINNDYTALKLALKPGVSKAFRLRNMPDGVWDNSGYGLYMASNICTALQGSFLIASGNTAICNRYDRTSKNIETEKYDTRMSGTAIKMTISTERIQEYEAIQKEFVKRGEELARKMKNSIKRASQSSKGLIEYLD